LRSSRQFPEPSSLLEGRIAKIKVKYPSKAKKTLDTEEYQGISVEDEPLGSLVPPPKNLDLDIEDQSALLKTLLKRSSAEESKRAEAFEGPIKKLLNPEMYEVFKRSYVPYEVSAKKIEEAEHFFTAHPQFKHCAGSTETLNPPKKLHQVSFAGRSNVGKSSLLNRLFGEDKKLVRVSSNPGFTQTINYYELGATTWEHRSIYLIDMPGYGFARAAKTSIKKFQQLVVDFLNTPISFQHRCYVLIDARVGLGDQDKELIEHLEGAQVSYQIRLTKSDKVSAEELQEQLLTAQQYMRRKEVSTGHPWVITTSAKTALGIPELKVCICLATGIIRAE
jgi:GTP-binding protein